MNILLFSMPDSFEHMPTIAIRMPNGALTSLAGNVDPHHRVAAADLLLVQDRVRETVERLLAEHEPDVVGLSVMTFQRKTAKGIIDLVRTRRPRARVVVGGYDPSLAPEAYTEDPDSGVDFIVRGEGEITFRELLRALEAQRGYDHIAGLSYRSADRFRHNPARGVSGLEDGEIRPPRRDVRVLGGYTLLGRQVDVIETSRGCTFDCSFCSIIEMRGRNFHAYSFERVLADIRDARDRGARSLFIVDDNITLNVRRFEALCRAIIDAGLNDLEYTVQAMTSAIANHGERLARLMRKAGFRYVFLGIENILEEDLRFLRAESKNRERENGEKSGNATLKAIDGLALHPAPHAVSGHADDQGFPGPRADHQRAARGIRWHHRGRQDRTSLGGRGGVPAVAGGALDEAAPHAGRVRPQPTLPVAERAEDVRAHLPRQHDPLVPRARRRAQGLPALPGHPARRARLCVTSRSWPPSADLAECSNGPRGRPSVALR